MPEEVVILCSLLGRYGKQRPDFVKKISINLQNDYLINYIEMDQIDFKEVCKIYQAISRFLPSDSISPEFQNKALVTFILRAFDPEVKTRGFYADSLPYMIPLVPVETLENDLENI